MTAEPTQNGSGRQRQGKRAEPAETQPAFEAQLEELDGIVTSLEDGRLPLEDALALYERGMRLAKACQDRLDEAELRVRRLRLVAPDSADESQTSALLEDFETDD
jgi:exodeoxyribonuclease VII small subunit